jgi:DNA-binding NtrC family response regulator
MRRISNRAIEKLARYEFPGNIRELRNVIERAMILSATPEIGPEDFPIVATEAASAQANGNLSCMTFIPEALVKPEGVFGELGERIDPVGA